MAYWYTSQASGRFARAASVPRQSFCRASMRPEVNCVVDEARGRLFRRKDARFLIYVPKDLAEDSMFPFKDVHSLHVKISFKLGDNKLLIEKWREPPAAEKPQET